MTDPLRTEELAVLLNLIEDDAAGAAMKNLDSNTAGELGRVLKTFEDDPPSPTEINSVLDDFDRFFQFAMEHIQSELGEDLTSGGSSKSSSTEAAEETFEVELEATKFFPTPPLTGDIKHDLNLLHPYQIAYAIQRDHVSAIARVIRCLHETLAAKTLEFLPADIRIEVYLQLAQPHTMSDKVAQQILQAALDSALKVKTRVAEENPVEQMVALTRSLPKNVRTPMLEKLLEQDEELAKSVKSEIYQFDDLLLLSDRDVQKVLSQCDSDALVLTLVNASSDIKQKLLDNMSKRARQTIEDEIEFKANAQQEEIDLAERQIVDIFVRMDEDGEIAFE